MVMQWREMMLPFTSGLMQRGDARAQNPPALAVCLDGQFDDDRGLQTRKPFVDHGETIFGGGGIGLNGTIRHVCTSGEELLAFTDSTVYSWSDTLKVWVSRGTHLATTVQEQTRFATNGDQQNCERAELGNIVVFTWIEPPPTLRGFYAILDKATGAVLQAPTLYGTGASGLDTKLVALNTKILLVYGDGIGNLEALTISPTTATVSAPVAILSGTFNLYFDAVKVPAADTAIVVSRRTVTTSYTIAKVTSALGVTTSTKARTCDGPIAVSVDPSSTNIQVVRANGTNVQGDLISFSVLADVFTGQAIGTATTTIYQIAAAHRTVANSGQFRCYVFWGVDEEPAGGAAMVTKSNWVDTGNTLGAQLLFQPWVSVASRAFDCNGSVYFWGIFDASPNLQAAVQGTYILFRDDGLVAGKATAGNAYYSATIGCLPSVALTGTRTYSWAGTFRREVSATVSLFGTAFAARAPRDITVTFDTNNARRAAQFGPSLLLSGGEILQYDGVQVTEVGFHIAPYYLITSDAGAGAMDAGTYGYEATLRSMNANGEIDRSTSLGTSTVTIAASHNVSLSATVKSIWTTHKTNAVVEIWRTAKNPTLDAPLYLVTSNDPAHTSNPNAYLTNSLSSASGTAFTDAEPDAIATTNEINPENGGRLENLAPPSATIIMSTSTRVFLAGIAGLPNAVRYSQLREDGHTASFNDALAIDVPTSGGDITGLGFLNETLIVFRQTAIYAFPGDGFDNLGGGGNYGPARLLSTDVGATVFESIALGPFGLIFKSSKGWHILDRGWNVVYIGAPIYAYDNETPLAVNVMEAQHHVRILTSNRMLVWDFRPEANEWFEWTIAGGVSACVWRGVQIYATSTNVFRQIADFSTAPTYGMDVELSWAKMNEQQGFGKVRHFGVLGEWRSSFQLRTRVAYDYEYDGAGNPVWVDDDAWNATPETVGTGLQMRKGLRRGRCEAIKIRLTAYAQASKGTQDFGVEGFGLGPDVATVIQAIDAGAQTIVVTVVADSTTGVHLIETGTPSAGGTLTIHINSDGSSTSTQIETALTLSTLVTVIHPDSHKSPGRLYAADNVWSDGMSGTGTFGAPPQGEALKLTSVTLRYGVREGLNKRLPAGQKA